MLNAQRFCSEFFYFDKLTSSCLLDKLDMEVCGRCGGYVKVIACIEDQDIIDRILAHLRDKELATPSLPLLTPPSRAPPETLPLFAGKESSSTALNQQGSH